MSSGTGVVADTTGALSPPCISCDARISRLPSLPPGWSEAKSSSRKPFSTSSAIANASPSASAAVVLAVGMRLSGHASSDTRQSSATSAAVARVDDGAPVRTMRRAPSRLMVSIRRSSSSVSPL